MSVLSSYKRDEARQSIAGRVTNAGSQRCDQSATGKCEAELYSSAGAKNE